MLNSEPAPPSALLIEQAIARGEPLDWIWDVLGADPRDVDAVLRRMDEAVADPDSAADLPRTPTGRIARPRGLMPCGTYSAAARHRVRGESVDRACRDAYREYQRDKKRRQRAQSREVADRLGTTSRTVTRRRASAA